MSEDLVRMVEKVVEKAGEEEGNNDADSEGDNGKPFSTFLSCLYTLT